MSVMLLLGALMFWGIPFHRGTEFGIRRRKPFRGFGDGAIRRRAEGIAS
jgi:hypothetical protein